jgi:hypothetical protein
MPRRSSSWCAPTCAGISTPCRRSGFATTTWTGDSSGWC